MKRWFIVLSAVAVVGCGLLPGPNPPENPCDKCTPEQECVDGTCVDPLPPYTESCQALLDEGLPWCHEAGMTCGDCVHNPSTDPRDCEKAADCPVGPPQLPQPQCPTFTDRGGTLQCQSDACDCYCGQTWNPCPPPAGCVNEPNLIATTCFEEEFRDQVKAATDALGDLCGTFWKDNLDSLAAQLRDQMPGRCVISGVEAIFIQRDDGKYEENHAVFSKNGCWTNSGYGRYIGCHVDVTPGPEPPEPTPPPGGECPAPHPDLTKMKFQKSEQGKYIDTTWITVNQPAYCASIGYCCMPGTGPCGEPGCIPRAGCPVRGDGDPERPLCEAELCDQKWECNGEPYPPYKGNPAQSDCRGHWTTWCSAPGSTAVLEGDR